MSNTCTLILGAAEAGMYFAYAFKFHPWCFIIHPPKTEVKKPGAENEDDLHPAPQKRFWRWSQRFTDNPNLKQTTGLQEQDLTHQQTTRHRKGEATVEGD